MIQKTETAKFNLEQKLIGHEEQNNS